MRALARVALALVLLAAAALGAVAWWLSGYVRSPGFQVRLRAAVRDATGQEASWRELAVGVLPPRVRVREARLGDGAGLAVGRADLQVALLPLLARTVVVDRVAIEGGVLRIVRSADGLLWPWQVESHTPPAPDTAPRAPGGAEAERESDGGAGFDFAVRRVDLEHVRIVIEDRTLGPGREFALQEVEARARARGRAALDVRGSAQVGEGVLRAEGALGADGALALTLRFERIPAELFAPYLGDDARLVGGVDGTLALRGPARAPDAAELDVRIDDAAFEVGEAAIHGPVSLQAELRGELARPAGRFTIDATGAELVYGGGIVRKPPGAAASAEGRIATGADGRIETEEVRIRLSDIGAQGALGIGGDRPLLARLDAPSVPLASLAALVPSLARLGLGGSASLDGVTFATPPLALTGRVGLDEAQLRPEGRAPIPLRGALVGEGAGLRSEGLAAEIGGQPLALELVVSGLDRAPRHRTRLRIERADAERLLEALAEPPAALTGPLDLSADLSGPLAGEAALAGLAGSARIVAGPGRIPGVAPFQSAVEQLEQLIGGLGDRRRARLRAFYGDQFESLTGHLTVTNGVARSDDLVLRYPGYALELEGSVRLADRNLDARGRLVLGEEAYAALAGEEPRPGGRERVLPLASVRGTVDAPRVALDPQGALALVATFAAAGKRGELERALDGVLGKGAGRGVLDALDGLLAPRRERR